jgi:hypothetical protein
VDQGSTPCASTKGEKMSFDEFSVLGDYSTRKTERRKTDCKIRISIPYIEKCKVTAKRRYELHKNHESQTIYSKDSELLGLLGESGFAILKDLKVDWSDRIGGDKYDFAVGDALLDIKTTENCEGMYIKEKAFHPKPYYIYIFAKGKNIKSYSPEISFIGWIRGSDINPEIKKNGVIYVPEHLLEDMNKYDNLIKGINNG